MMGQEPILQVCPVQGRQLKDVREEDLFGEYELNNGEVRTGAFRICNTYRGGGGYDQFPHIARKRGLIHEYSRGDIGTQFVVQLQGCHLRCPYCYVTKDGIFGDTVGYDIPTVIEAFSQAYEDRNVGAFHMMGGAPALHMEDWDIIPIILHPQYLFHSDLLLTEKPYDKKVLWNINTPNSLYAINIKGVHGLDHIKNTGKQFDYRLFWDNFDKVMDVGLNFYITFTNPDPDGLEPFKETITRKYGELVLEDSFVIELKHYSALDGGSAWL
jgi:uncharacterized Fe-S cluster-containing radical SAM superfamily protein